MREYDFLVDTGATWVGIPQADIDTLGLDTVPNASAELMMADGTISHSPIYIAVGMLEGTGFVNGAVPAAVPLVGYKLLQDLGFRLTWLASVLRNGRPARSGRRFCCERADICRAVGATHTSPLRRS